MQHCRGDRVMLDILDDRMLRRRFALDVKSDKNVLADRVAQDVLDLTGGDLQILWIAVTIDNRRNPAILLQFPRRGATGAFAPLRL